MAGLCEGGNEPSGSLKAICKSHTTAELWRELGDRRKRPLGRPRRRWEDNIKMDLREVGYDDRDWINLAQDRDRWRGLCEDGNELSGSLKAICKCSGAHGYG
ncbi:hypothetical protein ANN_02830 [Periplaneta americana]|uniref:Uncharacterized protein n=1 Tax=Periplaneta americana TaxID=6978 RepID=A0ABQ8TZU1_PERAM|nr:hypothetical protein ANN_02830 [Periplaneta americana]